MKTSKYFIEFDANEFELCEPIEITRKQYIERLEKAIKLETETKDLEFFVETHKTEKETDTYTMVRVRVTSGCGDMYLTHYKCKEGFHFK